MTLQLSTSNYNGYQISCFGKHDGSIDLTVTGGTPPYVYHWTNEATTQDITTLASGYYKIVVTDADLRSEEAEITLTEPEGFSRIGLEKYEYANGKNVSCRFCTDGLITTTIEQGIAPHTFQWTDGAITQDRSGIGAGEYQLIVTDANGCFVEDKITLTAPERDDWMMGGNTGSDPDNQFLGTSDNKDLVFRTNGIARLKLLSSGPIKFSGMTGTPGMLYVDNNGTLQSGFTAAPCTGNQPAIWNSTNSNQLFTCLPIQVGIGTYTIPAGMRLAVKGATFFDGDVGIGTNPQAGYKLVADGPIGVREVRVRATGTWPDFVFEEDYQLATLQELSSYFKEHKHLPGMPSASEVEAANGFDLGKMQQLQLQKMEELYLYIIQLEERVRELEGK